MNQYLIEEKTLILNQRRYASQDGWHCLRHHWSSAWKVVPALVSEGISTSSHPTMHRVLFMMGNHLGPTVSSVRSSKRGQLGSGCCQQLHHYGVSKGGSKDHGRQSEKMWKSWARKDRWPKMEQCYGSPWKCILGNCSLNILMLPIFLSFFYWQVITALTEKSMMIWDLYMLHNHQFRKIQSSLIASTWFHWDENIPNPLC